MSTKDDAKWIRLAKLAAVGGVIAFCFVGGGFLANGALRTIFWSAAASLALIGTGASLEEYLRKEPLDTSRAAIDAKAHKARRFATTFGLLALVFGPAAGMLVDRLHLVWALCGCLIGVFVFVALFFSPLFVLAVTPRPPASPLSRMTSLERAQRQGYE
jgi:hypothetical protein